MRYFLDMVSPPTPEMARQFVDLGWTGLAVYLGGPRAAAQVAWQEVLNQSYPVRDLAEIFDFFVPIWVGRNAPWDGEEVFTAAQGRWDGAEAHADCQACGFDNTQPICLDVEYGTWQAHPEATLSYILSLVGTLNELGHPTGVYSDLETLSHLELGEQVDFKYGAAWVPGFRSPTAPTGLFDPSSPPPWDLWQFGSTHIGGLQVDCNSAVSGFPGARYGP